MLSILDTWELRFGVRHKSRGPKRLPQPISMVLWSMPSTSYLGRWLHHMMGSPTCIHHPKAVPFPGPAPPHLPVPTWRGWEYSHDLISLYWFLCSELKKKPWWWLFFSHASHYQPYSHRPVSQVSPVVILPGLLRLPIPSARWVSVKPRRLAGLPTIGGPARRALAASGVPMHTQHMSHGDFFQLLTMSYSSNHLYAMVRFSSY